MSRSKNTKEEEHSDQRARLLFPETEFEAPMQCVSWFVASIPRFIGIPGFRSVLRGHVHLCTEAGKTRNRATVLPPFATFCHAKNASHPANALRKSFSSNDIQSRPRILSEPKRAVARLPRKMSRHSCPCSLSSKVLRARTTDPLEKDRFTRSCRCRRECRSLPQGKLGKILPSPKYALVSLT